MTLPEHHGNHLYETGNGGLVALLYSSLLSSVPFFLCQLRTVPTPQVEPAHHGLECCSVRVNYTAYPYSRGHMASRDGRWVVVEERGMLDCLEVVVIHGSVI